MPAYRHQNCLHEIVPRDVGVIDAVYAAYGDTVQHGDAFHALVEESSNPSRSIAAYDHASACKAVNYAFAAAMLETLRHMQRREERTT